MPCGVTAEAVVEPLSWLMGDAAADEAVDGAMVASKRVERSRWAEMRV